MDYHISKTLAGDFDDIVDRATEALAAEGFGVLTQIDVRATLKKKLDVDFRPYLILGACNPGYAHQALLVEDKVGTMLPCNVVVQERDGGEIEVSAVDPIASMASIDNPALGEMASEVQAKLRKVIAAI
ncbi:MAG: DUF302 domain-containing protein [Proteobacteria bacterium]|nr:DUF302 domain-containing protein [Pseudomonadota bacterium]